MSAHRNPDPLPGPGYQPPEMSADALLGEEHTCWPDFQAGGDCGTCGRPVGRES